jgi:type IV pilus assembly protein PilF
MMRNQSIGAAALAALLLTACTTNAPRDVESLSVEQAVSRQTPMSADRQRAKVHAELGRLYLMEGRYEVALDEARIALEAEGSYAPAHNLMALVYMALRKNELSAQSFRQALQLASGDPEINNDYGWFLCQTGKARESIGHFRVAIANPLFQAPGKALTNAGLCSLLIQEDRQAEDYLARALRLDRTNTVALYWLADIAYRGGRLSDAQVRMKELHAQMEPNAQSIWLALRVERKLGDREGEARFMGMLRRKHRDSVEYQKMSRGEFD